MEQSISEAFNYMKAESEKNNLIVCNHIFKIISFPRSNMSNNIVVFLMKTVLTLQF